MGARQNSVAVPLLLSDVRPIVTYMMRSPPSLYPTLVIERAVGRLTERGHNVSNPATERFARRHFGEKTVEYLIRLGIVQADAPEFSELPTKIAHVILDAQYKTRAEVARDIRTKKLTPKGRWLNGKLIPTPKLGPKTFTLIVAWARRKVTGSRSSTKAPYKGPTRGMVLATAA